MALQPRAENGDEKAVLEEELVGRGSQATPHAEHCSIDDTGNDVWIHIYDLGPWSKWMLNSWVGKPTDGSAGVPTAGAFHAGIEVCGIEIAYQASRDENSGDVSKSGVWAHEPTKNPSHVYRESQCLGRSPMCVREIQQLVNEMTVLWLAKSYHYVNNNCVDFAEAFAKGLRTPQPFPMWVHGLAKGFLQHTPLSSIEAKFMPKSCGSGSCASTSSQSPATENAMRPKLEVLQKQTL